MNFDLYSKLVQRIKKEKSKFINNQEKAKL